MSILVVRPRILPVDGKIPGGRGRKLVLIPKGTQVWCIMYERRFYWAAYLSKEEAVKCAGQLESYLDPKHKRHMSLETLLAWNFTHAVPIRIVRPGDKKEEGGNGAAQKEKDAK